MESEERDGAVGSDAVQDSPTASPWAPVGVGLATLAMGIVVLSQAWQVPGDLKPQGPRFVPVAIGIGWLLLAVAYVARSVGGMVRGQVPDVSERFERIPQVVGLLVLLLAYVYALEPLGYLISTSVFFTIAAAVLGSRRHVRDVVIAVGLAVALYFLFSRNLGIYLPPGVLPI